MTTRSAIPPRPLRDAILAWRLRRFIVSELLEEPFDGGDPLAAGAVDSLALEQLIDHLQERFDIGFADEELVAENFASVPRVVGLVNAKRLKGRADAV
ncbi:hypothetical protein BH20GEM1_BH20GEM1_21400 [soil metagenome]